MAAKPTTKQAKALELIREGQTPTSAMREAGYSEETSQAPGRNLLSSAGAQSIIDQYKAEYAKVGITQQYLAAKTAEWLEATKIDHSHTEPDQVVPDYQTQLKAADMVRKDWGFASEQPAGMTNILVIPSELLSKYGVTPNSEAGSS